MAGVRRHPKISEFLRQHQGIIGCWVYPSYKDKDGYAQYQDGGEHTRAHRAAYTAAYGTDPGDRYVCHSCDCPPCCNPAHLFLGDARANYEDSRTKGRHARGERNGIAVLTEKQVRDIRSDKRRQTDIADAYGICQAAVSAIKTRKNWRYLP